MGIPVTLDNQLASRIVTRASSITRPNNTTTYAADETWGGVGAEVDSAWFEQAAGPDGSGMILDAVIGTSIASSLQGEVWLFDGPVVQSADNAAWVMTDAEALKLVGVIPFTCAAQPSNQVVHVTAINLPFNLPAGRNLYYTVKVKNAYVPTALEVLNIRLKIQWLA